MWTLERLLQSSNTILTNINDRWVPARPLNYKYDSLRTRLRDAWAVFTGKAEAFTGPENQ